MGAVATRRGFWCIVATGDGALDVEDGRDGERGDPVRLALRYGSVGAYADTWHRDILRRDERISERR